MASLKLDCTTVLPGIKKERDRLAIRSSHVVRVSPDSRERIYDLKGWDFAKRFSSKDLQ